MIRIRGGRGLGDSIYLRPVVDHLIARGDKVRVLSDFPELFIGSGAEVEAFNKNNVDIIAHYAGARRNQETSQFDDVCRAAGFPQSLPFRMDWTVRNQVLTNRLLREAAGRPIVVAHGGRAPFGRLDGYGLEMVPYEAAFQAVFAALGDCFTVGIGNAEQIYPMPVGLNLNGSTTVSDLLDIASICDGMVAQCSFAVPLAEIFEKPVLGVWSGNGLGSGDWIIKSITPAKVLHQPTSIFVVDSWPAEQITETARAFRRI